jgi:hypothetical protein
VTGRKTELWWFTTELISASQPQIFGNPDLNSSKTGRLGDRACAVMEFSSGASPFILAEGDYYTKQ